LKDLTIELHKDFLRRYVFKHDGKFYANPWCGITGKYFNDKYQKWMPIVSITTKIKLFNILNKNT